MQASLRIDGARGLLLVGMVLMVLIAIPVMLLYGLAEISLWALEWMPTAFAMAVAIAAALLVPFSVIPQTRAKAAMGLALISYLFGALLWFWTLAFTFDVWGLFAVIVGVLLLGFGIIPIGFLAAVVNGQWEQVGLFALLFVLSYGCRNLANWLAVQERARAMREADAESFRKPVVMRQPIDTDDVIDL